MLKSQIKSLNRQIDFIEFLKANMIDFINVGDNEISLRCLSGRHEDRKPSFCFNYKKKIGFCHGCGVTVDAVGYIKAYYGFKTMGEVQHLFKHIKLKDKSREFLNAVEQGTGRLLEVLSAASKLKKKILAWNGCLPSRSKLHKRLIQKHRPISSELIEQFDLRYDILNKRVGFPLIFNGQILGVQWRNFQVDEAGKYYIVLRGKKKVQAKYYIESGTPKSSILFGWDYAKTHIIEANEVIVTEGVYCALSAIEKGFKNTVATFGCRMSEEQADLIRGITSNVVLCYDDDKAGRDGVVKVMIMLGEGISVKVVPLLAGRDVYDMSKKEFRKLYRRAKNELY